VTAGLFSIGSTTAKVPEWILWSAGLPDLNLILANF